MSQPMQITEKCAFVSFAGRLFSPEREVGRRDKTGAMIKTEKVQIIDPKSLNSLVNAKSIGDRACRRYGSRFDAMSAFVVPLCNIDILKVELTRSVEKFEEAKRELIQSLPQHIENQIRANPADESVIRSFAPSISDLENSIRISWVRHNLAPDDMEDYGLSREFNGVVEQVAWEIAQDVKTSTGTGTKYSKNTLDVLSRAADKAESFGFLSESFLAIKPAVQQLKANVNMTGFTPADRLMIGAMIAFLSDHKKITNEGRKIGGVMVQPALLEVAEEISAIQEEQQPIALGAYSF